MRCFMFHAMRDTARKDICKIFSLLCSVRRNCPLAVGLKTIVRDTFNASSFLRKSWKGKVRTKQIVNCCFAETQRSFICFAPITSCPSIYRNFSFTTLTHLWKRFQILSVRLLTARGLSSKKNKKDKKNGEEITSEFFENFSKSLEALILLSNNNNITPQKQNRFY